MMAEGGSRKKPELPAAISISSSVGRVFPEGIGEVEALAGGSWECNQLMRWHSPVPRRIGVGHVCVCVYLGALTQRREFPPGYMLLSQDSKAVKERCLHGTSLDRRAQPAATPQLLPCVAQPPPAPCVHLHEPDPPPRACSVLLAPFRDTGKTGSPRPCPSN